MSSADEDVLDQNAGNESVVTDRVLLSSAVLRNEDKGFCDIFSFSKSKCDLD
jgi:hypothetical protein